MTVWNTGKTGDMDSSNLMYTVLNIQPCLISNTTIKNLQAPTLVGPTRNNPVLDPLGVLHLDNCLFMNFP